MENTFFDNMFYMREQELTHSYMDKKLKEVEIVDYEKPEKELFEILETNIKSKDTLSKAKELIEKIENILLDEDTFNTKYFYQLGFKDGMELKQNLDNFEKEDK